MATNPFYQPPTTTPTQAPTRVTNPFYQAPGTQRRYLQGGLKDPVGSIFDILRTGEFAVGGVLSGKGIKRGVLEREESQPHFERVFQQAGMAPGFANRAAGFVASLVIDPLNLVGTGLVAKGLRLVGAAKAAVAVEKIGPTLGKTVGKGVARVAPELAARRQTAQFLERITERQVIREARILEKAVGIGKAIRTDAQRISRDPKTAKRLDQALGGYFDAGADTFLNRLAAFKKVPGIPDPHTFAKQTAQVAQQGYLNSLPAEAQAFVKKWIPHVTTLEDDFAQNLVRNKLMTRDDAWKWQGIHLRRIYERYEDPTAFLRFLQKTDPADAARLLGKLESGAVVRKVKAIPKAVTEERRLLLPTKTAALGEIEDASSRLVAGGHLVAQAVARGEAYSKIARLFSVADDIATAHSQVDKLFRQMGETKESAFAPWGALQGRWVPKQVHDALVAQSRSPEGFERIVTWLTGQFKFAKVILNPATHFRNFRTNLVLIHNAVGLRGLSPDRLLQATREVLTNGAAFREAKGASSAFVDTFTNSEIRRFIGGMERADTPLKMVKAAWDRLVARPAARAYEIEEQVGKMAVYLTARGRGLSPRAAGLMAEKALFNYRKVPAAVARMRSIGIYPFITFPYKIATETLPQIVRRPGRVSQQVKSIEAFRAETPEAERRVLPAHMRQGAYVRLPWRDARGRPIYYDLTYEYIFGDLAESGTPIGQLFAMFRGEIPVPQILIPLLTPIGQLIAEIATNKSIFTGGEIRRRGESEARAYGRHVARTVLPGGAFATGETLAAVAGLEPEPTSQLARAVTGTKTRLGTEPTSPALAAASTFGGARTVPLDVRTEKRARALDLKQAVKDAYTEMYSIARNPNYRDDKNRLTPEGRKKIAEVRTRLKELIQRFRKEGIAE